MTKVVAERRGAAAAAAMDGYKVLHSMLRGEYTEESNGARTIRQSGGKDRHSKVFTSRGPRDRRVRLSVATAIRFYDLQDRLGFDQPSKAVEWLLLHSQPAIQTLPQLGLHHLHPPPPPPPNPPPNSPLLPSLTSNLLPPLPLASLNHPLISNLNPPLDPDHINDPCHTHHALNTICHATHAQDCEDHPPHAININHHTPWPSNPTPNPILKHTSCPNLIPNPPQTSLEDDPQYSNYSSASSGAPIRLSSSPPNPTALQLHHNKRKRSTQSPTNHHHQFSISDLQDDYTCSSNFTSHEPYLPAQRLTIFNEAPMNYCSTSEYNNNNINNNIPSNNNWLPSQDQLNAHTHHHHEFPTNNAIQLYKPSFANHEDNTRLCSFDEPNLAESHLIISQQVTNSLAHESCDMQQIAPQQLDELDYGVPSPSESTSMKASCCKGMQESKYTNGYGGGQPGTTGNYNCVSSASSATSNVVETNAFSGWAISNAGSSYRQAKFQYNSTDQI